MATSITQAKVYALPGWMNYRVRLCDGTVRRVYWRNHNRPYIKIDNQWILVWFDPFTADDGEVDCEVTI